MARALLFVSILALGACSSERIEPPRARSAATSVGLPGPSDRSAGAPEPPPPWLPLEAADPVGAGSAGAVALARLGDRTLAFVADADDGAVVTFDVDARQSLTSTAIGARPSAVLVAAGRVVVLGADDARVHVLAMAQVDQPLVALRAIEVPQEPVSAAIVPGGDSILVASRWGHALSVVALSGEGSPTSIDLPRDPAAVVASSDGRRAFVMHAVGSRASIVDLDARTTRTASLDRSIARDLRSNKKSMPFEGDFDPIGLDDDKAPRQRPVPSSLQHVPAKARAETVTLHVDQGFALVRTQSGPVALVVAVDTGADARSDEYGGGEAAVTPSVVSFDEGGVRAPLGQRVFGRCLLPRGAAVDGSGRRILVACLGSDEIGVLRLGPHGVELRPGVRVPAGPVAVAVDERGRRAVVWSAFDRVVSELALDREPKLVAKVALVRVTPGPSESALRGRALFHATTDPRVSSDGRACASCHPDARDDGLAWSSPGGRRQTPMLVERLEGTAPYGWDGAANDLEHHVAHTTARLGGMGLASSDVADLQAYIAMLHTPAAPPADDEALVARGEAIFHSDDAGCGGCHAGAPLTDGDTHDVHSASRDDARGAFDTPSLHLIAHSGPYFHDGRYATLSAVLMGSDGTMGHTGQLSPEDRAALEAYVRRL
jgi:mono/diheme cytochrome c family protein